MSSSERGGEGGKIIEFIANANKTRSPLKNRGDREITDINKFRLKKEIRNAGTDVLVKKAQEFLRQCQKPTDVLAMASVVDALAAKPYEALVAAVRTILMHPDHIKDENMLRVKAVMHAFILKTANQKNT